MLFNSITFLLFFPIVFLVYWFVVKNNLKLQNAFILLSSYVFYGWWDWRFLALIIASSAVDYFCGLKMGPVIAPVRRGGSDAGVKQSVRDEKRLLQVGNESNDSSSVDNLRNDALVIDSSHLDDRRGLKDLSNHDEISPSGRNDPSSWKSWFSGRKKYLTLSLAFNLGLLGFFKYFNFFIESATDFIHVLGFQAHASTLNLILPVGISFYTFQTMSYTIDVYRGKMEASKDPIAFFAFVAFFPQLVAGPIERASNLLPQFFKKRVFDYQQGSDGMKLILWGLFKKMVIADNCALVVNPIFENYQTASGIELIIGAVLFGFQIYGDFSGYSDIAIGTAKLLGFDLMTNFRTPYFSRDIAEFWRRWHISLSTWFRDYVYIPLGGSRVSTSKAIRNIFIVFLVSGFWHGANWTFIAWGGIHAALFIPIFVLGKNRTHLHEGEHFFPSIREVFQIGLTFSFVSLAWVFFRSDSIADAISYLLAIFTHEFIGEIRLIDYYLVLVVVFAMLFFEWLGKGKMILSFKMPVIRYASYFTLAFMIMFFGAFFNPQDFIYFQF